MAGLNQAFADAICARLDRVEPDARPLWGKMNRAQLYGHLNAVVCYTMGQGPDMPFRGNFISRRVFSPLIRYGVVAIPRNIRVPRPKGMKENPPPPEATLDELRASLAAYLAAQESGALGPCMHPFFGTLSPRQWSQFHQRHFEHHLKQFGV